jgi:hypothetical protein
VLEFSGNLFGLGKAYNTMSLDPCYPEPYHP